MTTSSQDSYDYTQDVPKDSTRGSLLTDVQMSVKETPMSSSTTMMALNDSTMHDIYSILERPINLGTYTWSSNDTRIPIQLKRSDYDNDTQTYLTKLNFPQDIFAASPIVVDKLKNYQYLKADIEVEIKVNAQPFLQGALMLVYNPYYDQVSRFRRNGTRFMASQTSCPHKIMSIEDSNSLKLTLPYCNIYDLFDLSNSQNQFGTAFLYVFAPLEGVEPDEIVHYTVFARFVNPQFYVPTSKDVISEQRTKHEVARLTKLGFAFAQSEVSPVAAPDTGETQIRGPVSKAAAGVAMVAEVAGKVPIIGTLASSVAWVARTIQGTAASLGWSKPTSIIPQCKVVNKPMSTLIHTEGNDDATTLALIQDNGIDGSSFIPETKDEMAFSSIFSMPNYFHAQSVDKTTFARRNLITKWEVSPFSKYQYDENEDPQTLYLGSFAYASMMGSLWRGTINYDIRLIKTPYHNGRFAVIYFPETNIDDVPSELSDQLNTNYNVIFNLKDRQDEDSASVYRVSVPFISNTPWRETYKRNSDGVPDASTLDTKTGCVAIYSLVDLSSPPTVSDRVTFYIAHSGGSDYQISRPLMNLAPGFQSAYAQADIGKAFIPEDDNLLVPQHSGQDVTAQTTGEYFHSLRAFIKRFSKFTSLTPSDQYIGIKHTNWAETFDGRRSYDVGSITPNIFPTPLYMASFLFRFFNGSVSTKLVPGSPWATIRSYLSLDENVSGIIPYFDDKSVGQPIFEQQQGTACAFEVRTPYYRAIRGEVVGTKQEPLLGGVRTNYQIVNNSGIGTLGPSSFYEAAGDDFNFFFQIGPPPMCDIKNVSPVSQLPLTTFNSTSADYTNVTDINTFVDGQFATASAVIYTPSISPPTAQFYGIYSESTVGFTLVYQDTTTIFVPINECGVYRAPGGSARLAFRYDTNKLINEALTVEGIKLMGTVDIYTDAPLT